MAIRVALRLHVFMQSLPMREAPGVAASRNKKEVKVSPHMAESSLRVLIDNSTVWIEGHLPALSINANLLPPQAPMSVEVCQQELPVCVHAEIQRYYGHQAGRPGIHEGG